MSRQVNVAFRILCILLTTSMWAQAPAVRHEKVPPGKTVRVNGSDIHYQIMGVGEPLLLLHGFFGCGDNWKPLTDVLAKHYQLVIPDLRGHGWSTNAAKTFTHGQSAADMMALLDQLGLTRVRAMGASSGAMTLVHMATQQPERIAAMVLISGTSYFPDQARVVIAQPIPPEVRRLQGCAKRGVDQFRELEEEFTAFKDSYNDMNFTAPLLSTIKARTLIVHGDRDIFFPVAIPVEMYRAISGSELWIIPQGGHVPIFGPQLPEFLRVAQEFLNGRVGRQ